MASTMPAVTLSVYITSEMLRTPWIPLPLTMNMQTVCRPLVLLLVFSLLVASRKPAGSGKGKKGNRERHRKKKFQHRQEERETVFQGMYGNFSWPYRDQYILVDGNITLGGLMMVHERDEDYICGKVMPQGGIQATEAMLYTVDNINRRDLIPGVTLGVHIKDDCDRDIYGLEQSLDFIRG